ncbi:MAG: amidohydrolase family protein, partial [Acidimicrobiia bacterium]
GRGIEGAFVVDLSSLWAGPLCGALLAAAGADVVKVESTARPDGARSGNGPFFDLLNGAKRSLALDLATDEGRRVLAALVAGADVVIEGTRPRALRQLGVDAEAALASSGPAVWVSITGHGRDGETGLRVGFGDDAAAAGGLVAWDDAGPCFCADAVADPVTGMVAALGVLDALAPGAGNGAVARDAAVAAADRPAVLLDVALARVAASLAGPTLTVPTGLARARPRSRHSRGAGRARDRRVSELLVRCVDVLDVGPADVRVRGGAIAEVGPDLPVGSAGEVVDGSGGALLPGLHDHHIHLFASAARDKSVVLTGARDHGDVAARLRVGSTALAPGAWLRATGYHPSIAGELDRWVLDGIVGDRPVRVQHRSGAQWVLNSVAVDELGLDALDPAAGPVDGIERDRAGVATGRLHRLDTWLRTRLPDAGAPDLAPLLERLVRRGVTGVTDTTASSQAADLDALAAAVAAAPIRPLVVATGGVELAASGVPGPLVRGPVKLIVDDAAYPAVEDLAADIVAAHAVGRAVAIHCVTRVALVLCLAAFDEAGGRLGDRLEHGGVIPPELHDAVRRHRLAVVTQPRFVAERGDAYLAEVDADDVPWLYPCRTLLEAGIPVAAGSDAPYADVDPWRSIEAATQRTTQSGAVLGVDERVDARAALDLYLGLWDRPGGTPRRVAVGEPADLCLLSEPLAVTLRHPAATEVAATIIAGRRVV